jgi:hypothetical protein
MFPDKVAMTVISELMNTLFKRGRTFTCPG